jgi:hypothetical protein
MELARGIDLARHRESRHLIVARTVIKRAGLRAIAGPRHATRDQRASA